MTRLAASVCALLLQAAALAQQPGSKPPLTINDDTVGTLRTHQVASIIVPDGKPPFPAVIVLHGCNGVSQSTRVWGRRLASWGYAALILDSFSPRGVENVCGHGMDFSGRERAKDTFAAAAYLRARSDIDGEHIGLLGYSHGGWTALVAAAQPIVAEGRGKPFAAAVAYYPNCPQIARPLASDVQILMGDADDWTPAKNCREFVAKYADASAHKPLLKIYPGAVHSFDADMPARVYFGHKLAYNAAAATDSFQIARQFLDSHLKH